MGRIPDENHGWGGQGRGGEIEKAGEILGVDSLPSPLPPSGKALFRQRGCGNKGEIAAAGVYGGVEKGSIEAVKGDHHDEPHVFSLSQIIGVKTSGDLLEVKTIDEVGVVAPWGGKCTLLTIEGGPIGVHEYAFLSVFIYACRGRADTIVALCRVFDDKNRCISGKTCVVCPQDEGDAVVGCGMLGERGESGAGR